MKSIIIWPLGTAIALLFSACSPAPYEDASPATTINDFELIPREAIFGDPDLEQGLISPDGTRISYIAPVDGVKNVWVAPIDDISAGKPVSHDTLRGTTDHSWSYSDRYLLYMRDVGGDENTHVMRVDLETGEVIDLTPYENTQGRLVGGSYRHPERYLIGMNDRDPRWHDVYSVDLATGERELVELNDGFGRLIADHDLQVRLAWKARPDGGFTYFKKDADGAWVEFIDVPAEDAFSVGVRAFSADGKSFYMRHATERDKTTLYEVDFATGEQTVLAESDVADIDDFLIDVRSHAPVAYSVNHLRYEWHALDDETGATLRAIAASVPGDMEVLAQDQEGSRWIIAADAPQSPVAYYLVDREDNSTRKLFDTRSALSGKPLVDTYPVVIQSRDGLDLLSYLTLPPHVTVDENLKPSQAVPMMLWVHGGPWMRNEYGFSRSAQLFANRGYAVLEVNYRGSSGFGKAFLNAAIKEWGAAMHDDLIDGVNWAVAAGYTTADQVAIGGGSYGGYATLVGMTFTPDTFACGVDLVGPSNLETLINSFPEYMTVFVEIYAAHLGDPRTEEGQRLLRARSPVHFADKIRKPLLIGQGANDPHVPQQESDQIVEAMKARNLPVTYLLYPDEGHGMGRAENWDSFFAVTEAFLAECLGGRAEAFGDALDRSSLTVPHGIEFIPGLEEAISRANIIEKH